ncbi:MAG: DUF624 domain-containing protein [Oscillospiraceae bacterium]|nr:DUF624 domain-containing protein [Oscillospiraceae bacterium]
MKKIFDMENPFMRTLSALADLIVLNLLTLLCFLPVITAGAALTALNSCCIRLIRQEDDSLLRDYFRAFRLNFKKATLLWLLFLLAAGLTYFDYLAALAYVPQFRVVIFAVALILLAIAFYAFALLSRYENTIGETIKNAVKLAVGYFPRTLGMLVFAVAFWFACIHWFSFGSLILLLVGLSLPVCLCVGLLDSVFKKIETDSHL